MADENVNPNIPVAGEPAADPPAIPPVGSEQAPAGAPAEPPAPAAPAAPDLRSEIDKYNAKIAAELEGDGEDADTDIEGDDDRDGEDRVLAEKEPDGTSAQKDDSQESPSIVFDLEADTPDTYAEKKKAVEELFEEIPAPIAAQIEYLESRVAKAEASALADLPLPRETVIEIATALDKMYDTETDDKGNVTPNVAPAVKVIRDKYERQFPEFAREILATDSTKYKGATMMEEFLVDEFGVEKASAMLAFGTANIPLPTVPAGAKRPEIVPEQLNAAWAMLPEPRRFEIESLINEIKDAEASLATAGEYYKDDIQKNIVELKAKLVGEQQTLQTIQNGIDAENDRKVREQRQAQESAERFNTAVNTEYNTEIFGMMDAFAETIAPNLPFAEAGVQKAVANDIQTRVINALGFEIYDDGSFGVDPRAEHFAGQLTKEGVKFDFAKGRQLLQDHYKATRHLVAIKNARGVTSDEIKRAEHKKASILREIKVEQQQLLGQITRKYVKSNADAVQGEADKQLAKKQVVRPKVNGRPGNVSRSKDSREAVARDIEAYNKSVAAKLATGEELYDYHSG